MHSESMAGSYTKKEFETSAEEQALIKENGTGKITIQGQQVKMPLSSDETDNEDLNTKSNKMLELNFEHSDSQDRRNIVYMIMILHGIGALIPWNMFITAKSYFSDHKLSKGYIGYETELSTNFLPFAGFASQIPNVIFSWLNIFLPLGGNLTARIVWGILIEAVVFLFTIALVMVDTHSWAEAFFWVTMVSIVVLNIAGGIYQNSVFGIAAKLPGKYTGAVVLGSNISGTFTAVVSLLAHIFSPDPKSSAIYYFLTALFVLLACFGTYFVLRINSNYRYHNQRYQEEVDRKQQEMGQNKSGRIPYFAIFKQCWIQNFNVWFTLFVTLAVFPAVQSDIKPSDDDFYVPQKYYADVMCFVVFNVTAMIGSWFATKIHWPKKEYLVYAVLLRAVFIPMFLFCNYRPQNFERTLPIYIDDDWVFLLLGIVMGLTSGHFSALGMQYGPTVVDKQYSSIAGMYGAAFLVTGVLSGVSFSGFMPHVVGHIKIANAN